MSCELGIGFGFMWYFYVVRCSDGSLYAGITTNISRRTKQHNKGNRGSKYTRSRRPVVLVHRESVQSRVTALKLECKFKALSKDRKEEYIKQGHDQKPDTEVVIRGTGTIKRLNDEG